MPRVVARRLEETEDQWHTQRPHRHRYDREDYRDLGQRNWGLGMASFVISLVAGLGMFGDIVAATLIAMKNPAFDEKSPEAAVIGLLLFGCGFLCIVALGLGIAAICMKNAVKLYGILGVIFSAATLLVTFCIMLVGLAAG